MNETIKVERHVSVSSVLGCEMAAGWRGGVDGVLLFEGPKGSNSSSKYE